jgi:hypothetical protein
MRTKIFYEVSMAYCCGRLGIAKNFNRYSDALEFATIAKQDEDNTDICICEYTITKKLFKKADIERKTIIIFD